MERRVVVGGERECVTAYAVAPPDRALDVVEEAARVAPGDEDRDTRHDHGDEGEDQEDEREQPFANGSQRLRPFGIAG
jgi:hypothetical protein